MDDGGSVGREVVDDDDRGCVCVIGLRLSLVVIGDEDDDIGDGAGWRL